ncbi:uncharacterized protein LOC108111502 [Drosophila eugracilis]|uniref:uncharacterized protein LOC108111502 n=1 Tax=Drosophila eugracilis TaxID=29029 RepID=UPI001BDA2FEE|nr:uncharacterized protein LOC108111502 [Drosophila eugracilis]
MSRYYCGYNPPPSNFKTFFPEKYKDRLKRLPDLGKMRKSWEINKRFTLIMLHVFADDIRVLEKWMDMVYQLAAPGELQGEMDFYVDDMWQSYIFNEDNFEFFRNDDDFSVDSYPLIYVVSPTGQVHFFGDFRGPKLPDVETLRNFCHEVKGGTIRELSYRDPKVEDINLDSWNEVIYTSDEDIALCLYDSLKNGTEVNNSLMKNLDQLGDKLKQESVKLYKMDISGVSVPKKFTVESTPAFFVLQAAQKHNPQRCKYELGVWSMLRFVCENSTEELSYYNRRGHLRLHANLLVHINDFFDLSNNKHGYFM